MCGMITVSEESADLESDEDETERDPMPEITEIRFVPEDVESRELSSVLLKFGTIEFTVALPPECE